MHYLKSKKVFVYMLIFSVYFAFTDIIKDDFQVNEEDYPATFRQSSPAVARDSSGNFIVVWTDERDGDWDIRARLYSTTGNPIGPSFRVNDDAGMATQGAPAVACDYYGNFVVTWEDLRNGFNIYARRFDNTGNPLGSDFLVNDDAGTENQYAPSVSLDRNGDFVITWMDYRNYPGSFGYIDIYAQRYNSSGSTVGANFRVNDIDSIGCSRPDVAMAPSGSFVVTWYDERNGSYDVIAQRYDISGNPVGSNFTVTLFPPGTWQGYPAIAMDGREYFTFSWEDYRGGVFCSDIWATRYDNNGNSITFGGFQVDDDPSTDDNQHSPDISAAGTNGRFTIAWEDLRNGDDDVYAQRYDGDGNTLGSNFQINDDATTTLQTRPSISLDFFGGETYVWQDTRDVNWDIYARFYDSLGNAAGPSFEINDDTAGAYQSLSDIAYDTLGSFVTVWVDMRNSNADIFGQRFDEAGNFLGANFKINDDVGNASQTVPAVAMADDGSFIVAWRDSRNGGATPDVYAQRFDTSGNPIGANFMVNSANAFSQNFRINITATPMGKFAISWEETKFYDENGNSVGTSSLAGELDADRNGVYYVVFGKTGMIADSLFLQKFNSTDGSPIGPTVYLDMAQMILNINDFDIGCDSLGNFVVAFEDLLLLDYGMNIYAHRFDSDGNVVGSRFPVNEDSIGEQTRPRVDMADDGYFAIAWSHQWNLANPEIYAQRYLADGNADGANFLISNTSSRAQTEPSVGICDTVIYFSWTDNRLLAHGNDIFAKILGREIIGINSAYANRVNVEFIILPSLSRRNFIITYPSNQTISLRIYDSSGRTVKDFSRTTPNALRHTLSWDGTDQANQNLPAGVYFIQLQTPDQSITKKVIKLK